MRQPKQFEFRADGRVFYSGRWKTQSQIDKHRQVLQNAWPKKWIKYKQLREAWISQNGPCARCGSDNRLTVDHIDPREKQYNICNIWGLSEKCRTEELAKCQVLCASCHSLKTWEDIRAGLSPHPWDSRPAHCAKKSAALVNTTFDRTERRGF